MTTLTHIDSGLEFDVNDEFSIPVDLVAGVLSEQGDYLSGGSVSFELPKTPRNEQIIGDGRGMIRVVLTQGSATIVGELLIKSERKRGWSCELEDIRTSAFRRLKDLPAREVYMDDLNHEWTGSNVVAIRTDGWIYPFVDYGYFGRRGQTLQLRNFRGNFANDIFNFRPAIFAHEFITRAFNQIGWQIELPDGWFRNLVIPCTQPLRKSEGQALAESGAMYASNNATAAPEGSAIAFDISTNPTNFDTTTGVYIATSQSFVNFRLLVPAFNQSTFDRAVALDVELNGIRYLSQNYIVPAGQTQELVISGSLFMADGDTLSARAFNSARGVLDNFPGAGSRLEVSVFDSLAFASTIKMSETMPNLSAGDLIKWVFGGVNIVLDTDATQSKLKATLNNQYYVGEQELQIDEDSFESVTLPEAGQNNYLSYSGKAFANGGFSIQDTRLSRENELFTSGFEATQMTPSFGGLTVTAKMYDEAPRVGVLGRLVGADLFSVEPVDTRLRLLLVERRAVEDIFEVGNFIQIVEVSDATHVNYAYFYDVLGNSELSLAYTDIPEASGINLAELCFQDYANDFVKFKESTVLAALLPGQVSGFDFSKVVTYRGERFKIMAISQYVEGQLCQMTMRRIGTEQADMQVLPQIGKDNRVSTGAVQSDATLEDQPALARCQIVFGEFVPPVFSPGEYDEDYNVVGDWGDPFGSEARALTVPATGYYAIFYQVTASGGEGRQLDFIRYRILDESYNTLFIREFTANVFSENLNNEEFLQQGWKIQFELGIIGLASIDFAKERTFATVTQRAYNG